MVTAVRITPLEINPQNQLLNVRPLNDAFNNMRRANEFDAQQRFRYDELDTREADMAHRRRNDDARLGLERQRVGIAERSAAQSNEERVAQMYGNMAATIDSMPDGAERSGAWAKLIGSNPRMPEMLTRYGQNPADHINGPRFLMAQTMDAVSLRQMRAQQDRERAATTQPQEGETPQGYRINEQGELERAGRQAPITPATMRGPNSPAIAGPTQGEMVPTQSIQPGATDLPGITLNRPLAVDRSRDWSGGAREADVAGLWPRIRASDQSLTVPEINRAWTAMFGRQPKAGHVYNLRGQEVPNTPEQSGGTTTQNAARAAVRESIVNVADARERISQTNFLERWAGHATGIGEYAQVLPVIETAAASVMHGLSGAQVNIPETNRWISTFKPEPLDSPRRINFKLSHLQSMLMAINRQQGGNWTDEDKLKIRNEMRKGLGLKPVTMQDHLTATRQPLQADVPGDQPPRTPRGRNTGVLDNPYQGLSDEDILRQLQGR